MPPGSRDCSLCLGSPSCLSASLLHFSYPFKTQPKGHLLHPRCQKVFIDHDRVKIHCITNQTVLEWNSSLKIPLKFFFCISHILFWCIYSFLPIIMLELPMAQILSDLYLYSTIYDLIINNKYIYLKKKREMQIQSLGLEDPHRRKWHPTCHFQYSWLENPKDRGTWWVTVHGVTKSWTWLKQLST